ncbi:MAG: hypothetical protein IH597_09260 [Bacteroidales bacterium]|nr:hypothetical protein [Bacteroidales bacterium]
MKNTIALLINTFILVALMASLAACNLPKEKVYKIEDGNKGWLYDGDVGSGIIMADNNGISESFLLYSSDHEFSEGASGYFFVTTEVSKRESFHQAFSSTYSHRFSLSLSANYPPFGDELYVNLDGITFAYDLKYNEISRLDTPFGYKSKTMTDEGYSGYIIIESTVEMLNHLELNGFTYDEVLKFTINDFPENWTNFTIREIFIAREHGLVKYVMNNGIEVLRSMN